MRELKEGTWLEPTLALLRRGTKEVWTDTHRNVARKLIVEVGWVQGRFSILDGRMKTNAKDVTQKKAQRGTGFITVHAGTKSDVGSQRCQGSGSKNRGHQKRRNGSGRDAP